ncbi:phosphate uptake regulator PhoU [Candidatus Woesearchaeota archaeon]|nr:phosphate uptake regulator PhoU [Candidatus Woesearchaeota archaeon]
MERKVIQLAGKTLVVSLPSKWAKKYGIKKGDTLFLDEKERQMLVSTKKGIDINKAEIILKGPDEFVRRNINIAYQKGVDELSLRFEKPETKEIIEEALSTTMGFEIISQGEKSCTIKSVAAAVEEEFSNILRRAFLTILAMADESYDAVSKSQFSRLKSIAESDRTVNKLTDFCKRILNKKGYKEGKLTNYVYCIVWELERIGDEYRNMCRHLSNSKTKISPDILQIYRETNSLFRDFYTLFHKFDEEEGVKLSHKKGLILKKCISLIPKKKGADSVALHCITNVASATYDLTGPYYAIVL